jgi:GAF domain-containing protein
VFEDLAELAAGMTGCSRAFITLVDDRRSFWKSCIGVDAREIRDRQNRVEDSFCYFLVGIGDRFAVDDAATDPRTRDHPSVKPMKIGAWAGYPILSSAGDVLGSMCVIDENPHAWQAAELAALGTLARAVSNEISLRQSLALSLESLELSQALAASLQDSLLPPVLQDVPGHDTLTRALADCRGLSAPGIVGRLGTTLAHHSGDWASDDTALLALRVPPGS